MSYDLAVWEGDSPANDAEALAVCVVVMERMEEAAAAEPPTDRIREYVSALLARWPDITDDDGVDSPWADGRLMRPSWPRDTASFASTLKLGVCGQCHRARRRVMAIA